MWRINLIWWFLSLSLLNAYFIPWFLFPFWSSWQSGLWLSKRSPPELGTGLLMTGMTFGQARGVLPKLRAGALEAGAASGLFGGLMGFWVQIWPLGIWMLTWPLVEQGATAGGWVGSGDKGRKECWSQTRWISEGMWVVHELGLIWGSGCWHGLWWSRGFG